MAVEINHNAFSRTSMMRTRYVGTLICSWCGNRAKWKYGIQQDGISRPIDWSNGQYCSIGCYRSWNG